MTIVSLDEHNTDTLKDPTPSPPPVEPTDAEPVPLSDAEWDAAASAEGDALPELDPPASGDTKPIGKLNGKLCEVCKSPLTGKQRRFCNDHTRSTTTTTSTSRRTWKGAAKVEANLTDLITTMAGGLLFFPEGTPVHKDGDVLYKFGPKVAHELVILADDDPRLRRILERLAAPGKYGPLVIAVGGLVLGLASNHGLLPHAVGEVIQDFTSGGEQST